MNEIWKILFILLIRLSRFIALIYTRQNFYKNRKPNDAREEQIGSAGKNRKERNFSATMRRYFFRDKVGKHSPERREFLRACSYTCTHPVASVNRHCFRHIKYGRLAVSGENGRIRRVFLAELSSCKTSTAVVVGDGGVAPQFIEISPRGARTCESRRSERPRGTFRSRCYPGQA